MISIQQLIEFMESPSSLSTPSKDLLENQSTPLSKKPLDSAFFQDFAVDGISEYISNSSVLMSLLPIGTKQVPISVTQPNKEQSYICSLQKNYIDYALHEIKKLISPKALPYVSFLLKAYGKFLGICHLDRLVTINTSFCSVTLYNENDKIEEAHAVLLKKYPKHALLFRGINEGTSPFLKEALSRLGYKFLFNRPVFLFDGREGSKADSRMHKSDLKALSESAYRVVTSNERALFDCKRLSELYRLLNIEKHSSLNPNYTPKFFQKALETPFFSIKALEKEGRIDAFFLYFQVGGVLAAPIFGYDTSLPEELNLYRILNCLLLSEAKERKALLHMSSGAKSFKVLRRAREVPEYLALYTDHLPLKQRIAHQTLRFLMNRFAPILCQKN